MLLDTNVDVLSFARKVGANISRMRFKSYGMLCYVGW